MAAKPVSLVMPVSLEDAKKVVSIPTVWEMLKLERTTNYSSTRSPFRSDSRPSFSVFETDDGVSLFKDHATDECGDVVSFVERATNCTTADAIALVRMIGGILSLPPGDSQRATMLHSLGLESSRHASHTATDRPAGKTGHGGAFDTPTNADLHRIAETRKLGSTAGLQLAVERRMLATSTTPVGQTWVLLDDRRLHGSQRPLSGDAFPDGIKAKSLKGSDTGWPIGLADAKERPHIVLCEGAPDTVAAFTILAEGVSNGTIDGTTAEHGVIMMGGASCSFRPEALELLRDKFITVVPHLDNAGHTGAEKWTNSLRSVGASVRVFDLTPYVAPGDKDLNDALRVNPLNLHQLFSHHGN